MARADEQNATTTGATGKADGVVYRGRTIKEIRAASSLVKLQKGNFGKDYYSQDRVDAENAARILTSMSRRTW